MVRRMATSSSLRRLIAVLQRTVDEWTEKLADVVIINSGGVTGSSSSYCSEKFHRTKTVCGVALLR